MMTQLEYRRWLTTYEARRRLCEILDAIACSTCACSSSAPTERVLAQAIIEAERVLSSLMTILMERNAAEI